MKQAQGFIKFYQKLPEDLLVVRFFDRKDYFTAHGDAASFIARTYYRTMTAVRQLGSPPETLSSVSISRSMFETILRDLLLERTDHTVELYEGSGAAWKLAKTATPGKLGGFEDVLLRDVLLRCNVLGTEKKRGDFKARDVEQDLARLLKGAPVALDASLAGSAAAQSALAALLGYTELLADDSNHSKYSLQAYSLDSYMRLDAAALKALNVLESKRDASKSFSLFGLMNRTLTAGMGKRLLNRWLKQPLVDAGAIRGRHDVVAAFVEATEARQDVRQHLRRIPDIERLVRKVERRRASLHDIVKLYQASVRLPFIRESLEQCQGEFAPALREKYGEPLREWAGPEHLGKYDGLVEAAIDLDKIQDGEFIIAAGYDPSLGEIKGERDAVERQIERAHQQAADDLGLAADKTLKLDKTTQHGHVLRISKKEETHVRKRLNAAYVTLETRKDGVKFTNAKLRRLSEQFAKLTDEYAATQRDLVAKVVEVAATFVEVFEGVAALLAELDVLLSFADLAVAAPIPYVRPTITSGTLTAYCLLCVLEGTGAGQELVPAHHGPQHGRQVGVNVLMAQVGCFVPCDRAEISARDCIFARVGAGDCQLRGVSTFMAEMLETASILKAASERSLIIIDELGRGTSTYDGFAPRHLSTAPPGALPWVSPITTAHIDEASRKLTMLYKSFGIHVAEFAHFPDSVVALARAKAAELEDFSPPASQSAAATHTTPTTTLGAKRKRVSGPDEATCGAARARQFLRDFAALPLDQMDPQLAIRQVAQLRESLERDAATNPWLQQLL
eukprot:jgi/Mesen1/2589/ME000164S01718